MLFARILGAESCAKKHMCIKIKIAGKNRKFIIYLNLDMSQKYTHPTPLIESYISSGSLKQKPQKRKKLEDEGHENKFIDARESRKILKVRQELAEEEQLHYEKKITTDQKNLVQTEINNTALDLAENSSDAYDDDDDGWEDDAEDQLHEEVLNAQA